jgi:hypothetical protein
LTIHPWGRNVNGDDEYVVTYTNRVKEILASYKCNTDYIKKLRYGSLENLENIKEDNSDPNDIYNSLYPANTYSDGKQ